MKHKITVLILFILIISSELLAQQEKKDTFNNDYIAAGVIIGIAVMFFMVIFLGNKEPALIQKEAIHREGFLSRIKKKLSGAVPIENEKDIMLDHNFDGIIELNNSIPPWFNILFYGTIIIGVLYLFNYHVFNLSPLSAQEYSEEIRIATEQRNELIKTGAFINENTVKLLSDDATLAEGKNVFSVNCSSCHGVQGGGLIGPNLTDAYWLHGGSIVSVFKTVKYGVPAKGMISWQTQLNPKQIQAVSNYILSLKGTNPANPKQPEGLIYSDSTAVNIDSAKTK